MLQKQVVTVALAKGLDTKTDEFQVEQGNSLILENARFYKTGKLQKRFGLTVIPSATTFTDARAVISDDNMLNVLADDGVHSYSEALQDWKLLSTMKDTVKISSEFVSKSPYNHFNPDMDVLTTDNLAVYAYREVEEYSGLTSGTRENIVVVSEDLITGQKNLKKINIGITPYYPKEQQKIAIIKDGIGNIYIHLFYDSSSLRVRYSVLDSQLNILSTTTLETYAATAFKRHKMDVCKDSGFVYLADMSGTTLKIRKFAPDGTASANVTQATTEALGYDSITDYGSGFSAHLSNSTVHVFFVNVPNGSGDRKVVGIGFNTSLTKTINETATSISDVPFTKDISIVSDSTHVYLATTEVITTTTAVQTRLVTITWTSGYSFTVPLSDLIYRTTLISRPFIQNSEVYVYSKCPELLINTGILINLSTTRFAGMFSPISLSPDRLTNFYAAGQVTGTCNSIFHDYVAYTAAEKSYRGVNNNLTGYDFTASIAVASIASDFYNDISAGTKTKVGETNYYTNGVTFALDNRGACELGFFLPPNIVSVTSMATGVTTPAVASKTFSYRAVYNFYNGKGELERSIPSLAKSVTAGATATYIEMKVKNISGTFKNKMDASGDELYTCEVVLYRTANGGSSYYRVSSIAANQFQETVTIDDAMADADLINNEILYTTGGVLENDPAPNARFSTAGGNRLFLGGLEEEDEIAFSKKQLFGETVAFADVFRIRISSGTVSDRSKLSALGYLDGKLIIFRENSIYYIAGDGPLETGIQDTYTNPEVISSDTGCIEPRSILNIPDGLLFKSKKGIYLLNRGLQVSYIGAPVEEFNTEGIVSAVVSDKFNEARFYTDSGNCLTYNYLFDEWSVFINQTVTDAGMWAGKPVQIIGNDVVKEVESSFTDDSATYNMRIKTPWLKLSGLQDFARIWSVTILGKYKSAHTLRVRAYYDYDETTYDEYTVAPEATDSQYQYRVHLKKQKCESVQFEIEDLAQVGESMELSALTLEVGLKKGSMKLPAARKY